MALENPEFRALWDVVATKAHQDQAVWFLNAFWNADGIKDQVENIWEWTEKFANIDPNTGNGFDHDEFWSHKFLEDLSETITVLELRKKLGEIDVDKNKRMCLSEYLIWKFGKTVKALVMAPQGDAEELEKAQALVTAACAALDEVVANLEKQKATAAQARKDEAAAAQALKELEAEEAAYNAKLADLEQKSQTGGQVSRNRAKNELEQLKAEDPLPLRRAKITNESAVRRAAASRKAAEEAAAQLEAAQVEAEKKRDEALEYLERVKASGSGAGQVWWMKRGMYEKQKYLPTAKQTMPYPKPE